MEPPALWRDLRRFTSARVALGRAGNAVPTQAHLAFQAAHAAARDAVHAELDVEALAAAIQMPVRMVRSACPDRRTYLLRPDLGRRLDDADRAMLAASPCPGAVAFVVADGLSAVAVQKHAPFLLDPVVPALGPVPGGAGPVIVALQARVAIGDAIGEALQAAAVVVLIGERPGLSAPDSLGAYLTWAPRIGRTDAERNCISNIREGGLPVAAAADKLLWLLGEMRVRGLSGVALKDEQPEMSLEGAASQGISTSVVTT